jgi:hypothetical protein
MEYRPAVRKLLPGCEAVGAPDPGAAIELVRFLMAKRAFPEAACRPASR